MRLLALVGAVALLAGCRLDLNVAVDLAADGSGTVRVTATADADLLARAPNAVTDLRLDDAKAAGWTVTGPSATESGGAQVVLTKPFGSPEQATAILAEINGPSGPLRGLTLSQAREFATVTSDLTGEVRLDGGLGAFADQALVQVAGKVPLADQVAASGVPLDQALGLTVTVDLPGDGDRHQRHPRRRRGDVVTAPGRGSVDAAVGRAPRRWTPRPPGPAASSTGPSGPWSAGASSSPSSWCSS